jgi:hypothetical protein
MNSPRPFIQDPITPSCRSFFAVRPPSVPVYRRIPMATTSARGGLTSYYQGKIDELEITTRNKEANLRRLQAQRNELNSKGKLPIQNKFVLHLNVVK